MSKGEEMGAYTTLPGGATMGENLIPHNNKPPGGAA